MYIESIAIQNFKSFLKRQLIAFEPGFNLLVGANNSGKTSVLEAMDLEPGLNEPHRSIENIATYGSSSTGNSTFEASIATSFSELRRLNPGTVFYIPVARAKSIDQSVHESLTKTALDAITSNKAIRLHVEYGHGVDVVHFDGPDEIGGRASRQSPNDPIAAVHISFSPNPDEQPATQLANFQGGLRSVGCLLVAL